MNLFANQRVGTSGDFRGVTLTDKLLINANFGFILFQFRFHWLTDQEIYARGRLDILKFFKRCIIVSLNIAFCGEMVTVKPCENNISHLMHVLCKTIECIMANICNLLSIPCFFIAHWFQ